MNVQFFGLGNLPRVSKNNLTPFGVELRKLRVERKLRIYDLAGALGVSSSSVSAWETGRREIPPECIDKIGGVFGLDDEAVRNLHRIASNNKGIVKLEATSLEARLLADSVAEKIKSLPPSRLKALRLYVTGFRSSDLGQGRRIDVRVPALDRAEIRNEAKKLRKAFGLLPRDVFNVVRFCEFALPDEFGIYFEIRDHDEMDLHTVGKSTFFPPSIEVSDNVYEEAAEGASRGRWILAHELGHIWLLHGYQTDSEVIGREDTRVEAAVVSTLRGPMSLSFEPKIPDEESAEWQADEFAAELLMPASECRKMSVEEIVKTYGVSETNAERRKRFLKRRSRRKGTYKPPRWRH